MSFISNNIKNLRFKELNPPEQHHDKFPPLHRHCYHVMLKDKGTFIGVIYIKEMKWCPHSGKNETLTNSELEMIKLLSS